MIFKEILKIFNFTFLLITNKRSQKADLLHLQNASLQIFVIVVCHTIDNIGIRLIVSLVGKGKIMEPNKPSTVRYALGPVQMVFYSIQQHRRTHQGKLPKRIELHPEVMRDFRLHLRRNYSRYNQNEIQSETFLGVPIVQNQNADQPRLITHEGRIEFL